ncbi:MAG: hypothetical protein HC913_17905 [Microscillaceae bacterium]|nr:hypothetical protein [Microscillaceae bacterium]
MPDSEKEKAVEPSRKIQLHLDGKDFEGFTLRMAGVVGIALSIIWLTDLPEIWVFLGVTLCWLFFFFYKIARFKEEAYQQIIEDLEAQNTRLEKSNRLLQNVVQDSLGMKVGSQSPSSPSPDEK